jgi:hypothetical protein
VIAPEDKPNFLWSRQTGESIDQLGIQGPPFDYNEEKDKFFVFVSATHALEPGTSLNQPESGATIMASPFLISQVSMLLKLFFFLNDCCAK